MPQGAGAPEQLQGCFPWTLSEFFSLIFLPPVGVFLQVGFGLQFWINILLTLLGYIPGIIHAVWVIARR